MTMIGVPERGRVFTGRQLVGAADVGPDGEARLEALARWLQDVAFADGIDAGLGASNAWVIRRTLISIEAPPRFAETLTLRTFCSALAKSVADRRTSIRGDGGARVEAEAQWVQLDPATRRPLRFEERFRELYAESAGDRRARSRLRHPGPPEPGAGDAERIDWVFRESDVDLAGHVNNAVYWQIAEEHLARRADAAADRPRAVEIEFRGGAVAGPAAVLRRGPMLWVLGADDGVSASISADPDA